MLHGFSTLVIENFNIRSVLQGAEAIENMVHLCVRTLYDGLKQKI
jgi:hypothetical protein